MKPQRYAEQFLHPDDAGLIAEEMQKAMTTTDPNFCRKSEHRIVYADGGFGYISVNYFVKRDAHGKTIGTYGVNQDITERKQAEEALLESEERYRAVVENSQIGILISGEDFKITFANYRLCQLLGCQKKDIIGHDFRDFLDEDSKLLVVDMYRKRQRGETARSQYEFNVVRKDGEKRRVEISSTVIKDPQGRVRTIAQLMDITKRKQVEEDLINSEERLRILFEFAPDAYYLSDKKGTFIDGNKAAEDLLGFKREELIGKSYLKLKLLSAKQLLKASKLLLKNIQGKGTGPDEFIINRKNGSQVSAEIRTFPVKIKGETLVLGIARDITERKKTEEEIRNLAKFPDENPNPVLRISKDGKVLYANKASQATLKSWKIKQGQLLTGKPMEFVQNVLQTKRQIKSEFELDARIFIFTFEPILPSNYVNIYGLDITEGKLAEKALQKNQAAFEDLYDHAPVGYHELDSQGRIIRINQTELNMLGYSKEEMLGKYIWEFAVNKEISEHTVKQKLNGILSNGHAFERSYRRKDGSVLPVVIEDRILHTDGGKISGVRVIVQDITEKKRLEEEKQDLENQFRESQKMESIGT
ncbi:PAS domain S-box protein, partial [bacterium]